MFKDDLGDVGDTGIMSPYTKRNPLNPYRGLQGFGAMAVSNPIGTSDTHMKLYTRRGQLAGFNHGLGNPVPATGFSGLSGLWDEVKTSLFSPIGLLILVAGAMVFGHSQGWFGSED